MGWIGFNFIVLLCILIIGGFGCWALFSKKPIHFWSGTTVDPHTIIDIKKYNKANAFMWFAYCIPMVVSLFVAPFHLDMAGIIVGVGVVAGFPLLIVAYGQIKKKYTKTGW